MPHQFSNTSPQQQNPYKVEPFFIEINLTPPSSPELSDPDSDLDSDDEIDDFSPYGSGTSSASGPCASSQTSLESTSPAVEALKPLSVLGRLLNDNSDAKGATKKLARESVIDHIHHNAASLADVKLLIPDYNYDKGFIKKLVSALGYHCAAGRISDADKEAIFTNILIHGGDQSDVYNCLHARINHFQKTLKHLQYTQRNRTSRELQENQKREQTIKKRIQEFPAHLRVPADNPEFLPTGATAVAEIYAKLLGLSWDDVRSFTPPSWLTKQASSDTVDILGSRFASSVPLFSPFNKDSALRPMVNIPSKEAHGSMHAFEPVEWLATKQETCYARLGKKCTVDGGGTIDRDLCPPIRAKLLSASRMVKMPPSDSMPGAFRNSMDGEMVRVMMPQPGFVLRADRGKLNFHALDP
ncbi:hypothetical protein PMIN03_007572 [Paraphaeosphaeria minitans]